jgi:hypothetical protein
VTPTLAGQEKFELLSPARSGFVCTGPGLRAIGHIGGGASPSRTSARDVDFSPGDRAKLTSPTATTCASSCGVNRPKALRAPRCDPEMIQTMIGTSMVLGIVATILMLMWQKEPPKSLADRERMCKIEAPPIFGVPRRRPPKSATKGKDRGEVEGKRRPDEAGQGEGRNQRDDSKRRTPSSPRKRDVLREKVQKIGILSIISGRSERVRAVKLFAQSNEVGRRSPMAGAKLAVGRGASGLSSAGSGPGGGGTGYGHIYGAGSLDHRRAAAVAEGAARSCRARRKEVSVGMGGAAATSTARCSKEQIDQVVRAHLAGIKYCYEKELQHKSTLSGGIDVFWIIQPDGTVSKANVKNTTMGDAAVEGCIIRQVKQWTFPKAPA